MDKKKWIEIIKNARTTYKDKILVEISRDKKVLDVGCVGQDRQIDDEDWLHNKLKRVCKDIDGIDIVQDKIDKLRERGYSVYTADQLGHLGKRYDVVIMSDILEHVDNPVDFLKFYSGFLEDEGIIAVTTPNANRVRNFVEILLNNDYPLNLEHTMWLCPKTFLEIAERAGLDMTDFYWLKEYVPKKQLQLKNRIKMYFVDLFALFRNNFNPYFMGILKKR
jgi:2-polyprenyl-3-methyl-5-hydroxy-6-metoxy-1,4-benzoquinol methylase